MEEFEGLVPRYPLASGEPIVRNKLSASDGQLASGMNPSGHQVFTVKDAASPDATPFSEPSGAAARC